MSAHPQGRCAIFTLQRKQKLVGVPHLQTYLYLSLPPSSPETALSIPRRVPSAPCSEWPSPQCPFE